jgi:hypothetical protein
MGEEAGGDNKVKETIEAVTGLVTAVPVYQDMAQPVAKELGKSLETLGRAINVALYPVSGMVWGFEQIKGFLESKLASNLKDVPPENIIPPKPNVAGPAIEALRYTGHEESLSDMYANLLAASMDKNTANGAHPAFVEIIKQLTPDEAKMVALFKPNRAFPLLNVRVIYKDDPEQKKGGRARLSHFSLLGEEAGVEFVNLTPAYLDNLCRLGLADYLSSGIHYTSPGVYDLLENHPNILALKKEIEADPELQCDFERTGLSITELGKQFAKVCVFRK